MEIVELGEGDSAGAVRLWQETGLTRPWNDAAADFARAIAGPSSAVLGVRGEAGLTATAMVGHDGHRGWVYYLAVSPAAQRSGLGRRLMAACEDWLVVRGLPKVQFMVRTDNREVLDFYHYLGYDTQDVVVLGRRLNG